MQFAVVALMYCWWAVDGGPGLAADPRPRHLSEGDFTGRADPARDDVHEGEQSGDRQVVRVVMSLLKKIDGCFVRTYGPDFCASVRT
jgi:hypothetical protein